MRLAIAILISAGIACSSATSKHPLPGGEFRTSRYPSVELGDDAPFEQAPDLVLTNADVACARVVSDTASQTPKLDLLLTESGVVKARPVIQSPELPPPDSLPVELLGTATTRPGASPPLKPEDSPSTAAVVIKPKRVSILHYQFELGTRCDRIFVASESLRTQGLDGVLSLGLASDTPSEFLATLREALPCP